MHDYRFDLEAVRLRVLDWFATQLPTAHDITVSPLNRPGAGISNETYFFSVQWTQNAQTITKNLVMRWPPQGYMVFPPAAYDMGKQFRLLKALESTNVPVPPALWIEEDPTVLGAAFYIMGKVDGWVPSDFPPYHIEGPLFEASQPDRLTTWWNAIDVIAKIHTLDWKQAKLDFLPAPQGGHDFMHQQIRYYEKVFAQNAEPMPPILAQTRDWLINHCPTPKHVSLCWGDARLGNMLLRDHKVAAVLDWEMACLGDPESDLGWFAHIDWATSEGRARGAFPRMAGLPTMAPTMSHYEQRTGR